MEAVQVEGKKRMEVTLLRKISNSERAKQYAGEARILR